MRLLPLTVGQVLLSLCIATSNASRLPQITFSSDSLKSYDSTETRPHPPPEEWNPLEHMSGIAPYHDAPGADISPPDGCEVTSVAFLIRHSCIYANDDEWEDFMKPFVERLDSYRQDGGTFNTAGPLAFLETWQSPINEDNLEALTEPGRKDAHTFGKRLRKLYPHLFPPKDLGTDQPRSEKHKHKVKEPFRVWTANSDRDVGTAKAFIKGAFPKRHEGKDGQGDGKYLSLIKVNNKEASWSSSLTPHKVCPAFSKEPGKPDAQEWLEHFGVAPLARLRALIPEFPWDIKDVIALMMLCGYESVIKGVGKSEFCRQGLFTGTEYEDFGYWNDLIYHKMTGYSAPVAPYLGIPWVNTSLHNLLEAPAHRHYGDGRPNGVQVLKEGDDLPDPDRPPNGTHSQALFAFFTHREEPPVALVALGIWNQTTVGPLPTDRRPEDRVWKTSHVLPFLGHVAIEKLTCGSHKHPVDYARVLVNGAAQPLPRKELSDGPGESCRMDLFKEYVEERLALYGDFEGACKK